MPRVRPFDENAAQYEAWFAEYELAYESELAAIRHLLPVSGSGLEIGVGSGRFAAPLGIGTGVEPSAAMRKRAQERGVSVYDAVAERLPFPDGAFDYALMVTTVCFVDDVATSFREVKRVLRDGGIFVVGFVDRRSSLGQLYEAHKRENVFYREATFYSTEEIIHLLQRCGFAPIETVQTVFGELPQITALQQPRSGHGEGGFVAVSAKTGT